MWFGLVVLLVDLLVHVPLGSDSFTYCVVAVLTKLNIGFMEFKKISLLMT